MTVKELVDDLAVVYSDGKAFIVEQSQLWRDTLDKFRQSMERESVNWRNAINIRIGGK